MKIAVIAPVIRRISENTSYGGIERIITSLVIGAADAGHQVTLYAPFGTDLKHDNLSVRLTTRQDVAGIPKLIKQAENELFKRIILDQDQFDIIHSHIEPIIAEMGNGNYLSKITKPIVITVHNQTHIDTNVDYYRSHQDLHNINFVFISHDQAKPLSFLPNRIVIYNGIKLDRLIYNDTPNSGQLAFLGRITPEKGIAEAIAIAKLTGKKLLIGAALDNSQLDFYENKIRPQIDGNHIIYLGEVNDIQKNELLRMSEALLFPIQWNEPFGLVIVEALATGTPVIASGIGSVPEIIDDGKTGYIVSDVTDISKYTDKLDQIDRISREYCRKMVEEKFTDNIMIDNYLKHYDFILKN